MAVLEVFASLLAYYAAVKMGVRMNVNRAKGIYGDLKKYFEQKVSGNKPSNG
jgi:hypothetical protein